MSRVHDWQRALRDSDLSPTARHVALALATYMDKSGRAWPALATLAHDTGRSRPVVKRAIRELRNVGFLEVEAGGGRADSGRYVSNRYRATVPNGVVHDPAPARRGVAHDPVDPNLTGSFQRGGGSSANVGGSPTTLRGVVHDPRTTNELPIEQSIELRGAATVAPDDSYADNGDEEDTTSSEEDSESQGQEPVADATPEHHHLRSGRQFAQLIADGKVTAAKASEMAADLEPDDREQFLQGIRDGAVMSA